MASTSLSPTLPPIRACLFDMDGLLIDSEDKYTDATNESLRHFNPTHPLLPWSIKAKLQGRPGPAATAIFMEWAQITCSVDEYRAKAAELHDKYFPSCQPLPGVLDLLKRLDKVGVKVALATSSHEGNFKLKTGHLPELFAHFAERQRVLGDDPRVAAGRGKPAPDIFLLALETINEELGEKGEKLIAPDECLVFEDSVPGVEAGRRAGMQVVWCPHPGLLEQYQGQEKEVLAGLTGEYTGSEEPIDNTTGRRKGAPGEIDDGWAALVNSLEGFPFEKFNITAKSSL